MPRILISGASGLIGSALVASLESQGYEVVRLVRRDTKELKDVRWDPMRPIPPDIVSGFEAIIHLSGESITGRWTAAKKARIRDSRVISTKNLSDALTKSANPPKAFLCASAIGYYGSRDDEVLTEDSPSGTGFLPEVCREWESATEAASRDGVRTVNVRTGIVLSRNGGALKPMLLPFRLGVGGKIGSGRQWWSWIHIEDFAGAVLHLLQSDSIKGPVNMVSPNPVTNAEFTKTLAGVQRRPAVLPVPAFTTRLIFGEFADEGILASTRVEPKALLDSGFNFKFSQLESALGDLF
jgi:uncharacterized protein